jgi:hypothetical protein
MARRAMARMDEIEAKLTSILRDKREMSVRLHHLKRSEIMETW